jgi:hypothetical protein
MTFPIHFPKVLKDDLFIDVSEELEVGWGLTNQSSGDMGTLFWKQPENNVPLYLMAASVIKLKVMRHLRTHIRLLRIHSNGQTTGQDSVFHRDFDEDDIWTFILFGSSSWDLDWGGEFICQDPHTLKLLYTPYIPNEGVLIPSNWWHKGCPPNGRTKHVRTSLAFSFSTEKVFEEVKNDYSFIAKFS